MPKPNRKLVSQWKCCISSEAGMLHERHVYIQCVSRRCDSEDCEGVREIILTREDFDPSIDKRRTKKTGQKLLDVTPLWSLALSQIAEGREEEKCLNSTGTAKADRRKIGSLNIHVDIWAVFDSLPHSNIA